MIGECCGDDCSFGLGQPGCELEVLRVELTRLRAEHTIQMDTIGKYQEQVSALRAENANLFSLGHDALRQESEMRARVAELEAGLQSAADAIERGSTTAPVLECLHALLASEPPGPAPRSPAIRCPVCGSDDLPLGNCKSSWHVETPKSAVVVPMPEPYQYKDAPRPAYPQNQHPECDSGGECWDADEAS